MIFAMHSNMRDKLEPNKPGGVSGEVFTDSRDGKKYKTVKIGNQTWMAENLNYAGEDAENPIGRCYKNSLGNCKEYGRLYNWAAAMAACPDGWHLPTQAEWELMMDFIGGGNTGGKKLKAISGWIYYCAGGGQADYGFSALPGGYGNSDGGYCYGRSCNGTDDYGFSALPGGFGNSYGSSDGRFYSVGYGGLWWSSSGNENDGGDRPYSGRDMASCNEFAGWSGSDKYDLYSVRCIKD